MPDRPRYGPWQAPVQPAPADAARWAEFLASAEQRIRDARLEDGWPEVKRCYRCRETLAVDAFARNRSRYGGRQHECRSCRNTRGRDNYRRAKLAVVRDLVRRAS